MAKIIEVSQLNFSYPQPEGKEKIPVLNDVSLDIEEGQFVAILGHNGCGKSTLAKHFNGILQADSGSVTVLGMDAADEKNLMEIRRNVGMVFQNPDNQIIATVVDEDVAFALENLGIPYPEMARRVDEALKLVDMTEYRHRAPHLLSGGQKQRVAIAGILAMRPKCIILDEPTAMLDPQGRKEVMKTILRLNREEGITVVLITHYMDEAVQADRVIVMGEGELILDGTPREVFQNVGLLHSLALDVPQTAELMFALRQEDIKVPIAVLSVEECIKELEKLLGGGTQ
ncbi:MAG: energy-coupling factor transporter ATPase [Clostridiales bacterium]|nr:MAG: energy-coupling factor transporter ATPase [Clostridiales bacterium]